MKKLLLILLILVFPMLSWAQKLTQEQAIHYAQKLYEAKILSEKGRDTLLRNILNKEFNHNEVFYVKKK
jgi:hypothetical protein